VILVTPLMLERARSLEDARARQVAQVSEEFLRLANHSADTQREVISSVETVLKSAAYIRASADSFSRSCDMLRASLPSNLPWIRNVHLVGGDGRGQCSTSNTVVGADLSDRTYVKKARSTGAIAFSEFTIVAAINIAVILAGYPVAAINRDSNAIVVASISLDWMSKLMNNLGSKAGVSAVLVDANRAGGADGRAGPDRQAARQRAADVGDIRDGARFEGGAGLAVVPLGGRFEPRTHLCEDFRHRRAADR
jgi:hypothetical protein